MSFIRRCIHFCQADPIDALIAEKGARLVPGMEHPDDALMTQAGVRNRERLRLRHRAELARLEADLPHEGPQIVSRGRKASA